MKKIIWLMIAGFFFISACTVPPGQIKKQTAPGQIKKTTGEHPGKGKKKY
jgi:starvation-inducible outer membrane lipoprotein